MPSTESIKVYTPPGTFASTGVLRPEPYPTIVVGNGSTFTEMIDQAGSNNSKGDPSYSVDEARNPIILSLPPQICVVGGRSRIREASVEDALGLLKGWSLVQKTTATAPFIRGIPNKNSTPPNDS